MIQRGVEAVVGKAPGVNPKRAQTKCHGRWRALAEWLADAPRPGAPMTFTPEQYLCDCRVGF